MDTSKDLIFTNKRGDRTGSTISKYDTRISGWITEPCLCLEKALEKTSHACINVCLFSTMYSVREKRFRPKPKSK